jgi:hypothetical protein
MRNTLAVAFLLLSCGGHAVASPSWCAVSAEGATNCYFTSSQQCRAANSSPGGFCAPEIGITDSWQQLPVAKSPYVARSYFEIQALRAFQRMP